VARFSLKPPKLHVTEKHVVEACVQFLQVKGYRPIRQNTGQFKTKDGRYITIGEPGMPDYAIPQFMVEFKRPGGRLSEIQKERIFELSVNGVMTAVVESVEELEAWLAAYQKRK